MSPTFSLEQRRKSVGLEVPGTPGSRFWRKFGACGFFLCMSLYIIPFRPLGLWRRTILKYSQSFPGLSMTLCLASLIQKGPQISFPMLEQATYYCWVIGWEEIGGQSSLNGDHFASSSRFFKEEVRICQNFLHLLSWYCVVVMEKLFLCFSLVNVLTFG